MQKVLDHLRKTQTVVNRRPISTQEHIQRCKKQKQRAAYYYGELNFNDFKAGSQDEHITQLDCLSRQIPLAKGFAPESYKHITYFQILKQAGVYDVEAIRTIQLFSIAFNMNNNKIVKEVIRRAEELRLIPKDQSGSKKG